MIYLRRFDESKQDIDSICHEYGIKNYTINDDGTIDVNDDVNITSMSLTKLALRFRNVNGGFYCANNRLITLEGAPQSVGGGFSCSNNRLITLEGAPQSVGGVFYCTNNRLVTLEGAPQSVGRDFYCDRNQLTTLEGAPQSVGGGFYCTNNQLVNLEFVSSCEGLYCYDNPINRWWSKVNDINMLDAFIDLGIDSRDPDFMNQEKINLLNE